MQRWIQSVALWFKGQLDLDEEKTEVVAYALTSLFLIFVDLTLLVLVCWFLGVLKEGLIAAFTGALLRSATGAHLSSPWRCAVLTALLPAFFGYLGSTRAFACPGGFAHPPAFSSYLGSSYCQQIRPSRGKRATD